MNPAGKIFVADALGKPGAAAGCNHSGPPRVRVPDSLRREILDAKAFIERQRPGTLGAAAPVLISIYSQWKDELARLMTEALAPFGAVRTSSIGCTEAWVLEVIVRDFPTHAPTTAVLMDRLNLIFENALAGNINLFAKIEPPAPVYPPRRFTRRWFKNLFRAGWHSLAGRAPRGGPCGGLTFPAAPVPPVSLAVAASNQHPDDHQEPTYNAS